MRSVYFVGAALLLSSCSPLKSSPREEKHQLELTLRGLQTNLDDQRHDLNCFQTELQILDGRIKYYENALAAMKQHELEGQQAKLEQMGQQFQALEGKLANFIAVQESEAKDLRQLLAHANETTAALTQFKEWIRELEQELHQQNRRLGEISKQPSDSKVHKVRPSETLEKIARLYKTSVENIKKENNLEQDLIVVGQQLRIPQ